MDRSLNKYRFALVSHSEEIVNIVKRNIDYKTEELLSKVVELDDAVAVAEELIQDGYEVIIGHGGTGGMIAKSIGQPVVNIPMNMLDIVSALQKAKKMGSRIGITTLSAGRWGFGLIQDLLNMNIREIVFNNQKELREKVEKAVADGVNVIVGGGVSRKIVEKLDAEVVIIEPGKHIVQETIKQARALAAARRREMEGHERLQTILNIMDDGMICVDSAGYLNSFNSTAAQMLKTNLNARLGQPLSESAESLGLMDVLESKEKRIGKIINLEGSNIVVNSLPIMTDNRVTGAVSLLKEGNIIQGINRKLRENIYKKGFIAKHRMQDIVAVSSNMQNLITKAKKFAATEAATLINGETGTGKEFFSHAIHNHSQRKISPFVAVNCAALSETLLESELFGYEEGAFTGAKKGGKIGLFELANHGTIFLDEIGDISPNLQVRLLRVLESKEVIRVGGDRIVPVDVRIVSSTHRDLKEEVRAGRFRKDLYYRLGVLRLNIPPLRNRINDIPELLKPLLKRYGKSLSALTPEILSTIQSYWWPGNIRELNALMESYLILLGRKKYDETLFTELFEEYKDPVKPEQNLPPVQNSSTATADTSEQDASEHEALTLEEQIQSNKLKIVNQVLRQCGNNKSLAADRLGISTNTLWRIQKKGAIHTK